MRRWARLLAGLTVAVACGGESPAPEQVSAKAAAPDVQRELLVTGFQFRDAEGNLNARGNHYPRGRIPWWLKLSGLTVDGDQHRLGIKTAIRAEDGRVMFESKRYHVIEQEAPASGRRDIGKFDNVAHIPALGTFTLELKLRDEPSGRETTMAETVVIEESPAGP